VDADGRDNDTGASRWSAEGLKTSRMAIALPNITTHQAFGRQRLSSTPDNVPVSHSPSRVNFFVGRSP
jgi:hypothetical protein